MMSRALASIACTCLLVPLFASTSLYAQAPSSDRGVDLSGFQTSTRAVDKTYPVGEAPEVFVSNRFGAIRVVAWDNPLVRVTAQIEAGAENPVQAQRFAQAIEIAGNHIGDRVEIRTVYPTVEEGSKVGYSVDLEISVPTNTTLVLENTFGDITVRGLDGEVSIDSRYGFVELHDLKAPVRVRAKGEFPLVADRLGAGGNFVLRSTQASFSGISGNLLVNNYLGSVDLRAPGDLTNVDITSESGPVHLYLPPRTAPHIEASVDFGVIESDLVLDGERWGDTTHGRVENPDSAQRFDLYASFDSIYIHQKGLQPTAEPLFDEAEGQPFQTQVLHTHFLAADGDLILEAMIGDIEVIGTNDAQSSITATLFIRTTREDKAQMALEGLSMNVDGAADRMHVVTSLRDDLEALGCTAYRIDLTVRCPSTARVSIIGEQGRIEVRDMAGPVTIEHDEGHVALANIGGDVDVNVSKGSIELDGALGPATLEATGGSVSATGTKGPLQIVCDQGKTVVDSPEAAVTVRNTGGDVRIVALEGVYGDYDVSAEGGNISVALPSTADALLVLNTSGGTVLSAVPVHGTIEGDSEAFQGRLNAGTHRVLLETHQGNIVIN